MSSSNVVSPSYTPGFNRQKTFIFGGYILLSAIYFLMHIPGSYLVPDEKYCINQKETDSTCTRPDLFAFESICGSIFVFMSIISIKHWYFLGKGYPQGISKHGTRHSRILGHMPVAEFLSATSFVFQSWDLVLTLFIPEFNEPLMIAHHILAATVSWFSLQYQLFHFYSVFFLAMSEISSVPLIVMSLCKYFPPAEGSILDTLLAISRPAFAVTFAYYRVFQWWKVSLNLWSDVLFLLRDGSIEQHRPGKSFACYFTLISNVILGMLQVYWFSLIVQEILKILL